MTRVGLTGGIGSGKSTVARMMAERGAVVVDADQLAREAVLPGTEGLARVVAEFGDQVLAPDGSLDRPASGGSSSPTRIEGPPSRRSSPVRRPPQR